MRSAYMTASANGTLPANPRQIYYAARPEMLRLTELHAIDSDYFCQTLLTNFMKPSGPDRRLEHRVGRPWPFHRAAHQL